MTLTEQLFSEIKNLGYNAELTNLFEYVVDKDRRFWQILVYDEPDERLINLVQSYNATFHKNVLYRKVLDEGLSPVDVYEVVMSNPDFIS